MTPGLQHNYSTVPISPGVSARRRTYCRPYHRASLKNVLTRYRRIIGKRIYISTISRFCLFPFLPFLQSDLSDPVVPLAFFPNIPRKLVSLSLSSFLVALPALSFLYLNVVRIGLNERAQLYLFSSSCLASNPPVSLKLPISYS